MSSIQRTFLRSVLATTLFAAAAAANAQGAYYEAQRNTQEFRQNPIVACVSTTLTHFNGTIVDAAVATPELSTLVSLVQAAGLVPALSASGFRTVLAPTNAAFAKIPPTVLSVLGGNVPLLTTVLTYHVIPGASDPRVGFIPKEVRTLQGQSVFYNYNGSVPQVNNSNVSCRGVLTRNGLVWIIDSVLQPQYR